MSLLALKLFLKSFLKKRRGGCSFSGDKYKKHLMCSLVLDVQCVAAKTLYLITPGVLYIFYIFCKLKPRDGVL